MKKLFLFANVLLVALLLFSSGCSSGNTLADDESAGILFMREEEKLARDVYTQLYDLWGINSFNNIASSEQSHMDAVATLIDKYGLADPAEGKDIGEFSNQELQDLHDHLMATGSQSEIDALKVGAAIEEIDILDLEKYMSQTDNQDILKVYDNLLRGSRNHLRSFVSVMEKRGVAYTPQHITQEQFDEIISSSVEQGGG